MCEKLERMIEDELRPFLQTACSVFEREGDDERAGEIGDLLQTFGEMLDDIRNGVMDEWECGELYDEFRRYRESGDFLDRIS
ncbi:hypothetical protein [Hydrogenimonas sp.]